MTDPIVIAGAGQAALQTAESLRAEGYDGPLLMIGEEPHGPYQRPPLSKQFLLGEMDERRLTLRAPDALERKGIELLAGRRVVSIDRPARQAALDDGRTLAYSGLVLATGCRPRPLPVPGAELEGVMMLRTLDDARRLGERLSAASRVAIIGGGFIGLEVAAAARKRGREAIVLEAADRLMARAVSPLVSRAFAELHEGHGVVVHLRAKVIGLAGRDGRVESVIMADGAVHRADLVVVGVGGRANDELAAACGLACDNGVIVDDCARTEDEAIVAVGDCAVRRLAGGGLLRLESVQNAIEQGKSAAAALLGRVRPFTAAPYFWTDQFGVKLQMAGLTQGPGPMAWGAGAGDEMAVRGSVAGRRFTAFYFRDGRLIGADSLNCPSDHMRVRKLLEGNSALTPRQAADEGFDLASA